MSLMQLLLASAPASGIVTGGLVMNLDAGNAASYPGSGTAWTDLSGTGNHLTLQNSPTWNSSGWFATGATGYFDRATGINVPQGNAPYTLQAWVRLPSWTTLGGIMSIGGFGTTNQSNALRTGGSLGGGGVGRFLHYWWANDLEADNNNASLALNTWFMITANFDGTTRRIYANTTQIASDTPGSGHNVTSSTIQLALTYISSGEYLQGDVAIARIYDRALPASEVEQNFNTDAARFGLAGIVTSGLVMNLDAGNAASYPGSGTAWTDLSGNGNNGALSGGFGYSSADGGQITFNGTNSAASCGNAASLQNNSASVEVWFKASNTNSSFRGLFGKEEAQSLLLKDNVLIAYDWGNAAERSTGVNVGDNTWRQAVLTVSGTGSNNAAIYINGALSLTTTIAVLAQSFSVIVGLNTVNQWLNGSVAISRFYNRALLPSEVLQNFNANRGRFPGL